MRHSPFIAVVPLVLTCALLAGCADRPAVVYEPPIEMDDVAAGLAAPDNGFALVADDQSHGRFACALAVARLMPQDANGHFEMVLEDMRPAEESHWAERMRGVASIRELVFLNRRSIRPFPPTVERLCQTALDLRARLLLVYAPNGLGPNSAQVFGVLYDARFCKPLATLHASSLLLNEDGEEVSVAHEKGDWRECDARYQAQRNFEAYALDCLRALIELDEAPPTTQPHRWHKPLSERWWLPDRD